MPNSFRFLHAADIHLDSPMKGIKGLSTQSGDIAHQVRSATRGALRRLVSLALEEDVDFVVIAGDLYDGDWRDYRTGLFFVEQMGRLNAKDIPLYLLYGNHDAESQITKRLELPGNVHVFGSRVPQSFQLTGPRVALHGQSFRQRDISENLVPGYPEPVPGIFNVGVLHTGLGGASGHANYAPCSLHDLVNKGYDYWALGHVHHAAELHRDPHVVFPGNLQGRSVRETGPKGACLVTVEEGEVSELVPVSCDVVRWSVLHVPVEGISGLVDVTDRIRTALGDSVAKEAEGRLLVCRVVLEGQTEFRDQIVSSAEQIQAEAQSATYDLGDDIACIEKVVDCTSPGLSPDENDVGEGVLGEIHRWFQDARGDEELRKEIIDDVSVLVRRLPHDVRVGMDEPMLTLAADEDYDALIGEVVPYLGARLSTEKI